MSQTHYKNISKLFVCRFNPSFLHILKNPRVLPCGNTACAECIEECLDKNGQIKCSFDKCKQKHDIKNVDSLVRNLMVEDIFDENLITIANHLVTKIKKRFHSFKESLVDKESLIEKTFEFIEDEIQIRIESIKIEFDNLQNELITQSRKIKEEYLRKLNNDFEDAEAKFLKYDEIIKDKLSTFELSKLKEDIYSCQNFMKEIQNFDYNFNEHLKKCSFLANDWSPDLALIGRIKQSAFINFDVMKKSPIEINNLDRSIKSLNRMFSLNNDTLLISSSDDNAIVQLDNKYNEIRRINSIGHHRLNTPLSICSDNYENIYICDFGNNCVLVTDFEFLRVKRIIGKKSVDCGQPIEPLDICFYLNTLYVLNKDSSYVTALTRNGDLIKQLSLYASLKNNSDMTENIHQTGLLDRPNRIGANNKYLAVLDNFRKVYIYDHSTGDLKQIIKSNNSTIMCLFDDYLFTCNRDGCLVCYQTTANNSKFVVTFERSLDILKDSKSYMCFFDNKFLIALTDSKIIVAL